MTTEKQSHSKIHRRRREKLLAFLLCLFIVGFGYGQNLVPNPSFEDALGCPSGAGEIDKATSWTTSCGSPDYYNTCDPNPFSMSVPNNWAGYQFPASGNAYTGIITYSNSFPDAREYASCTLLSPLNIGTKYYISFKVVLALTNNIQLNCASDKIGAMFTTGASFCNTLITNNPPVYTNSVITDSLNWTRISGSFVADSTYSNLVIGNFFNDANTDTLKFFNDFSDNAYYFLDDICVSTDSIYANNYSYTGIEESNSLSDITCYPNPIVDQITIQNLSHQKMDVEIYNLLGELLYTVKNVSEQSTTINLNNSYSGILFVKITSGQQMHTYKLIKL